MILIIRETRIAKALALLLVIQFLLPSTGMNYVFAGDGGPTQPEVQSFEPIGTNQMVDPFTGDFTYNIPLFNLPGPNGGYPVNLAYHAGVQMDQEASWVGLGWNINMGTITRQVRNLPDDFSSDAVKIKVDRKKDWTVSMRNGFNYELFGTEPGSVVAAAAATVGAGNTIYYNNYRGLGYSNDFSLGLKLRSINLENGGGSKISGDLGFNVKMDSREGISGNVSAGISSHPEKSNTTNKSLSVSTGFDRNGWQRSINVQTQWNSSKWAKSSSKFKKAWSSGSTSSTLSFAQPLISVSAPQPIKGGGGNTGWKMGMNVAGNMISGYTSIDFNINQLKNKNTEQTYSGVGYLYFQNQGSPEPEDDMRVKDLSLENDGLVHKDTRRLAIPTLTYDNYVVNGQGIGSSFRPHRTDIVNAESPYSHSEIHGGTVTIDVAVSLPINLRFGVEAGYSFSGTTAKGWPTGSIGPSVVGETDASLMGSVYFQRYGESTHDDLQSNYGATISNNLPIAYAIDAEDNFYRAHNLDQAGNTVVFQPFRADRRKRSQDIEPFTNRNLMTGSGSGKSTIIPEFAFKYYTHPASNDEGFNKGDLESYDNIRRDLPAHHIGGYTAITEEGMKYVYGLAAQNKKERDVTYTVKENDGMLTQMNTTQNASDYKVQGTDKMYHSVEKGTYAHSYMLTSILGQDYVDLDQTKGPSDGDLGYWVRFDYYKAHGNYQWKSPFLGANYNRGYKTNFKDGTANYSYGEKEIWYVATVETKTHVAEFVLSDRQDCKEISNENTSGGWGSAAYKQLNKINIYLKTERYPNGSFNTNAKPIKTCHFDYFPGNESLCLGTPDNNTGQGKLTLRKVWFTYRDNPKGATSPYEFEYNHIVQGVSGTGNQIYDKYSVDRWGNYQPFKNTDDPYVDQDLSNAIMNSRAGLWNLKAINLPSGGRYEIDYESDTYAYVQNEVAMQMMKVASLEPYSSSVENQINSDKNASSDTRKVYFKLEKPLPQSMGSQNLKKAMEKYIRKGEYLYFKVNINLTKEEDTKETVAGYSLVEAIEVDETSLVSGNYLWGYVQLGRLKVNGKDTEYHPFTEVGARHIRYNQPDILVDNLAGASMDDLNKSTALAIGTSLVSSMVTFGNKFRKYTESLYKDGDARLSHIDLNSSYLRLRSFDKVKYGGGHRVREIRLYDNWNEAFAVTGTEDESCYGTIYEYDMPTSDGEIISSGVATYEPLVGGDENPFRNPVRGWEEKNVLAKNVANTYTEDPGNENIFPGASVGYSQVRIMSKNTYEKKSNFTASPIKHYTGITVEEFFTSKDFPIINDVTDLQQNSTFRKSRLIVPALFANVDRLRMAATQGYYTELNNMHGKPKGAKEIALVAENDISTPREFDEVITSSMEYEYFDKEKLTTNRAGETFITRSLANDVEILFSDTDPSNLTQAKIGTGTLGTEIDFIPRTNYLQKRNISGSLQFNLETFTWLPLLYPIPSFNWQEEKVGTIVSNKVVNKSGILKRIIATQEGSTIETSNVLFDDMTGEPLLTTVTNDYDDKVYNYSILARDIYDRTGASYKNIGKTILLNTTQSYSNGILSIGVSNTSDLASFVKGDRILLIPFSVIGGEDDTRPKYVCYLQDIVDNKLQLETFQTLSGLYLARIIQSGRKNNLTTEVSKITALKDPTYDRYPTECVDIKHPTTIMTYFGSRTIDKVIGITATELGEYWYKDTRQISGYPSNWYDNQLYSKGFGGNFQPIRTYAYIDDRSQSIGVNLKTDGIMNDVPLFNFAQILAQSKLSTCIPSNWRLLNQVTMTNPSSANIESKNALGVYSSSLYGRNGMEPIAVSSNAHNTEIGFESFEEYTTASIDIDANSTNNLNFYATNLNSAQVRVENRFDIWANEVGNFFSTNAPATMLSDYTSFVVRIHFDAFNNDENGTQTFYPQEERLVRLSVADLSAVTSPNWAQFQLNSTAGPKLNIPQWNRRNWRGEIFLGKAVPNPGASGTVNSVVLDNTKGHTGDKSLKVSAVSGATFLQRRLNLIEGKEYQFSGWFSTANNQSLQMIHSTAGYFQSQFKVEFVNESNAVLSSITYNESDILSGTFIDEWQKFTLNFVMPAGAKYARIVLPRTKEVDDPASPGSFLQYALYDDLRIQPRDGVMDCYVYNNQNQRLEAELDANNYATFYYYDDEGNLFLVKKETAKGIITVQESRSFLNKD